MHHNGKVVIRCDRRMAGIHQVAGDHKMAKRLLLVDESANFGERDRSEKPALVVLHEILGVVALDNQIEDGLEIR